MGETAEPTTLESLNADEALQMGIAAHQASQFAIAEKLYRHAIAQDPAMAAARHFLGLIMRGLGRPDEALVLLKAALALDPALPASRHALGMTYMNMGDYRAGWPLYESRLETPGYTPTLDTPMWRGEPLTGKRIAVFPEQGLGDALQFARFAPLLRDLGAQVVLLCRPPLQTLFAHSFPGVEVQATTGKVDLGDLDYWVMMLSIPERLGLTIQTVPAAPYLCAPNPQPRQPGLFRIGLATRGNPNQDNDARRSLGAQEARVLWDLPGVKTLSLLPDEGGGSDFAQTADIVAGLDLVISVDTSVGHLAGGMGKPTLLLVPGFGMDWRWMTARDTSPWYPNHRLFRGTVDTDWEPALARIGQTVAQLRAATLTKGPPPPT